VGDAVRQADGWNRRTSCGQPQATAIFPAQSRAAFISATSALTALDLSRISSTGWSAHSPFGLFHRDRHGSGPKPDPSLCRGTQAWAKGLTTMRLMTGKRADTLLALMYQIELFTLARAWQDLTDDEFFWEPFTMTWSIRRHDQCRTPNPFGAGEWVADFEIPEPTPVPMTTIAWLYWHIGSMPGRLCDIDLLGGTRTMASGWTSPYLTHHPIFASAAEAVTALRDGWRRLREAIERADDDQLEVTSAGYTYAAEPPRGGLCVPGPPGAAHPATHFIAGTLNEVGHHGTQIGALRDLYAWRRIDRPHGDLTGSPA
jgi:hypothetical protein